MPNYITIIVRVDLLTAIEWFLIRHIILVQAHNSSSQWSERLLRNDDWQNNLKVITDVWLNVYGKIYYWFTSKFLIIPNAWLFNKSFHLCAREWYWYRNDHICVFLSKLTYNAVFREQSIFTVFMHVMKMICEAKRDTCYTPSSLLS